MWSRIIASRGSRVLRRQSSTKDIATGSALCPMPLRTLFSRCYEKQSKNAIRSGLGLLSHARRANSNEWQEKSNAEFSVLRFVCGGGGIRVFVSNNVFVHNERSIFLTAWSRASWWLQPTRSTSLCWQSLAICVCLACTLPFATYGVISDKMILSPVCRLCYACLVFGDEQRQSALIDTFLPIFSLTVLV
jgi:hypothetical protein